MDTKDSIADDLVRGMKAICDFIGEEDLRRGYYLAERGIITVGKEGNQYIASKARLRADYARMTAGKAA